MKPIFKVFAIVVILTSVGCKSGSENKNMSAADATSTEAPMVGQSGVKDDVSNPKLYK